MARHRKLMKEENHLWFNSRTKRPGKTSMFLLNEFQELLSRPGINKITLAQCRFGGMAEKLTDLITSISREEMMSHLIRLCDHPKRWWTIPWSGKRVYSSHPPLVGTQLAIPFWRVDTRHVVIITAFRWLSDSCSCSLSSWLEQGASRCVLQSYTCPSENSENKFHKRIACRQVSSTTQWAWGLPLRGQQGLGYKQDDEKFSLRNIPCFCEWQSSEHWQANCKSDWAENFTGQCWGRHLVKHWSPYGRSLHTRRLAWESQDRGGQAPGQKSIWRYAGLMWRKGNQQWTLSNFNQRILAGTLGSNSWRSWEWSGEMDLSRCTCRHGVSDKWARWCMSSCGWFRRTYFNWSSHWLWYLWETIKVLKMTRKLQRPFINTYRKGYLQKFGQPGESSAICWRTTGAV